MEQQTSFTFVDMETLKSENECNQNFAIVECEGISDTESNILISKNVLDDENLNTKETMPVVIESVTFSSENSICLPGNKDDYEENKDLIPSQIKSEFSNFGENSNNNGGDNDNDVKSGVNEYIEEHPIIVPVKLVNTEEISSSNKSNNTESQLKENTEVEDVYINDNGLFLINNEQLNDENKNYIYLKNEEDNENKDNIDLLVMKEEKPLNNCNDISSDDVNEKVLEIGNDDAVFAEEITETKYSDTTASSIKKRGRGRPRVLFKKTHPCSICHKVFSRKTHLTTHLRIHSDEKPYMCNLCCKRFRDNSVLIKHVRVHTQDKPYACLVCGKAFNQKGNMERHARQHTNEKPFICSVCGNAFNNKSHLQRHFRIHIDEKPFTCELCDKSFRQKSHLMRHVLVHSREKPYSCNLCNKRFRQEQHVTRHKKTHIKEIITGILLKQCISNPIPAEYI